MIELINAYKVYLCILICSSLPLLIILFYLIEFNKEIICYNASTKTNYYC